MKAFSLFLLTLALFSLALQAQDTGRMVEWFNLQLLGKPPAKAFTFDVSSLPSTPVQKAKK